MSASQAAPSGSTTSHHYSTRPDFEKTQASRPPFERDTPVTFHQPPNPAWKQGEGGNDGSARLSKDHVEIDPYEEGRPSTHNYKLLISGVVPRPIAFISTRSKDGTTVNLAPFSYFQVINHDPPLFTVGIVGSLDAAKDTVKNLVETEECVINIISEHFIEAANAASINAPYGTSEFAISGLHQAPCTTVKASRVKESIFSIEGRLVETKEFSSRVPPNQKTGVLVIIEGTRFWVREDALSEEKDLINLDVLRPVSRLGGIRYGRTTQVVEIPRPRF
jgi:flavin reductase (DIM6/NTAB) family NADH-FMN oxidoreductase RutF